MKESTQYDVLVIGAGAAGMLAACTAAENGAKTAVVERNDKVGRKLAITGKGRCNVTNDCDIETVMRNLPKNPRFMYSSLSAFPPQSVKELFESEDVPLKTERGNRVFPVSDSAYDIVDALRRRMKRLGVKLINSRVTDVTAENGAVTGVVTERGEIFAKCVIIATGGLSYPGTGSTGDGYEFAKKLGHTVTGIKPSLVPLETAEECAPAAGLSLKNVSLSIAETGRKKPVFREQGEMLFTHTGISGPLVLSASSVMGEITDNRYTAYIDFKPALDAQALDARIMRDFDERRNMQLSNALRKLLPEAVIPMMLTAAGIDPTKQCNSVTKQERMALAAVVKALPLHITAYRPIAEAIITDGGVSVKELDPKTMRSKLVGGLYFAGEVMDVTGFTGGFNLQTAFSTGYAAGLAAAHEVLSGEGS
ncbi:MAG: NAD(P)/FAD-dependent oxidoreductase [Ruminiclostridium sp.]|nr:NAD(P)/FAD-dependent oxidoreductase [Ruminiclostridium sp.]